MSWKLLSALLILTACSNPGDREVEILEFYCSPTPNPRLDECMTHAKPKWVLNCSKANFRSRTGLACHGYRE
jgi:hypothetical protein